MTRYDEPEADLDGVGAPKPDEPRAAGGPSTVCVVIAAYNEERVIADTVTGVSRRCGRVILVDDGSTDRTAELAAAQGAEVLRHPVNLGQGAALQTGIAYARDSGAQWIATFDADGQHDPDDLPKLLRALRESGADIALGSRFMGTTSGLPRSRRLLLKLAILVTWASTGVRLTDAHNGLRLMTAATARRLRITQNGMAHASEIVEQVRLLKLRHVEVPVHIRYTEYSLTKGQRLSGAFSVLSDLISGWISRW